MQVIDVVIPYRNSNSTFYFYPLNDWHLGSAYAHEGKIERLVENIIKTPNSYAFGLDDAIDAIIPKDKRWDKNGIAEWVHDDNVVTDQEDMVVEVVAPIVEKLICVGYGNHEDTVRSAYSQNAHLNILNKLNRLLEDKLALPYMVAPDISIQDAGFSYFLRLYFKRENSNETHLVTGYITHGSTSAITKAGKINALFKVMAKREADFYLYNHVHELAMEPSDYLEAKGKFGKGTIHSDKKVAALGGSYLMTYKIGPDASYGEMRTYDPTSIGSVRFIIDPQYDKLKVEEVDL